MLAKLFLVAGGLIAGVLYPKSKIIKGNADRFTLYQELTININHALANTRDRMGELFVPNQVLGRTQTIGCVAVEITQRCNLDCTLCYLSEHSQVVRDVPIAEIFKRLNAIVEHYGVGTHVQITGGDPTLRKHTELVEIVRYAHNLGLYTALFTNGIAASRSLLERLAKAGLNDVAFHVDTTQRREGYLSEIALNHVREEYLERARGLGLMVIFNTTVHRANFNEIPELVRFFAKHAGVIGLASFQLQADTGRGEWGVRATVINQQTVRGQLEAGTEKLLPWDVVQIGHSDCHSYMPMLVTNNQFYPVIDDVELFSDFLRDFQYVRVDRHAGAAQVVFRYASAFIKQPRWWLRGVGYGVKLMRTMAKDLLRGRGKVKKLSFFVQNFMDANELEEERVHACSFMVMTADGPVSMCEHNARRDEFILKPLDITNEDGSVDHYEPLPVRKQPKTACCG